MAVPVFYFLYKKLYGGVEGFDAGKFVFDAHTLAEFGKKDFPEYLKCLVGLQDEKPGSYFYNCILVPTYNWDNGEIRDFFYNDNRIVIRLHSLVDFVSFGSYFVHGLFSCWLSFIGLVKLNKAFSEFYPGRETFAMMLLCFFPSLWLYTGAPIKEGICVFVLGQTVHLLRKNMLEGFSLSGRIQLALLLLVSMFLKPYLLLITFIFFATYYLLRKMKWDKYYLMILPVLLFSIFLISDFTTRGIKGKSLKDAAVERRRQFTDLSEGGIFLWDSAKYVRLPYDISLIKKLRGREPRYTIREGVSYTYWEHSHQKDTLYCKYNSDLETRYKMIQMLPKAGSNVVMKREGIAMTLLRSFYFCSAFPFFINSKGVLQWVTSLENLMLLLSFLLMILSVISRKHNHSWHYTLLLLSAFVFVIIGFTTPNVGAMSRYRAPMAVMALLGGLSVIGNRFPLRK